MARVLFLGSGGKVGTLLRAAWTSIEHPATWHARHDADVQFDISADTGPLETAIGASDIIVNLAGTTHHRTSEIGAANSDLARHVLDHADGKPVVLMSTAAVYGRPSGVLSEDRDPAPISDYGHDKARMEDMALNHDAPSVILRLGNVAGADALLGVDRNRYILDMFEDGSYPCRSYIGPKQFARILADLCGQISTLPKILNVAGSRAVSMADLLSAASKPWDDKAAGPEAIKQVELDTSRLEKYIDLPVTAHDPNAIVDDLKSIRQLQ